ncbi:MAG: ATP-dependent helicase [Nitrospirota bacterium]
MEIKRYTIKTTEKPEKFSVDYARELNPEQYEAVMAGDGPILVIAGAGSGKTRTVTYRVARLMESGIDPSKILLVTFTNKAAKEMLHRAEILIKTDIKRIWGGTFHHIGNLILRRHAETLGYKPNFSILDREDSKDLINACISDAGINIKARRFPQGDVLGDIIGFSVNTEEPLEKVVYQRYPYFTPLIDDIERVAFKYNQRKKRLNLMDFDDLLLNWKRILEDSPDINEIYSNRFEHILVDEYQDTNKIQADIIDLLASRKKNLMVVGDDSQSIYSFRGANFANIIEFPKRYPYAKVYKLTINYRSTPEILGLANQSISFNRWQFPKALKTVKDSGAKPVLVAFNDVLQQAEFVAQRILELRDEGVSLNDIAALYRSHYHSMELQMALTKRGIPYEVRSGIRFFEQAHIKDVTSYMRIIINPLDEIGWKRILKLVPKIGNVTSSKIWNLISTTEYPLDSLNSREVTNLIPRTAIKPFGEFLDNIKTFREPILLKNPSEMIRLIIESGYEDYLFTKYTDAESRIEDLNQLSTFAMQYESTKEFLSDLALLTSVVAEDVIMGGEDDEKVKLSSVHQAKGLEWKVVFIIWLSDGRFPAAKAIKNGEGEEEERRLFYVAVTRARDEIYLCYPIMSQDRWQEAMIMKPSRFIQEIPEEFYEKWVIDEERMLEMGEW